MKLKTALFFAVGILFFALGFMALQDGMPEPKETRIYEQIRAYSPYKLEKRVGGFTIVNKINGEKEKPSNAEVFHRLDELEQMWGRKSLTMQNDSVLIKDANASLVATIKCQNTKEKEFVKNFFGIK